METGQDEDKCGNVRCMCIASGAAEAYQLLWLAESRWWGGRRRRFLRNGYVLQQDALEPAGLKSRASKATKQSHVSHYA